VVKALPLLSGGDDLRCECFSFAVKGFLFVEPITALF